MVHRTWIQTKSDEHVLNINPLHIHIRVSMVKPTSIHSESHEHVLNINWFTLCEVLHHQDLPTKVAGWFA
jgi:hypothetical protein